MIIVNDSAPRVGGRSPPQLSLDEGGSKWAGTHAIKCTYTHAPIGVTNGPVKTTMEGQTSLWIGFTGTGRFSRLVLLGQTGFTDWFYWNRQVVFELLQHVGLEKRSHVMAENQSGEPQFIIIMKIQIYSTFTKKVDDK